MKSNQFNSSLFYIIFILIGISLITIQCSSSGTHRESHAGERAEDHQGHDHDHNHESEDPHKEEGDPLVHLTDVELAEFGIQIDNVKPAIIDETLDLTGEIQVDPSRLAHMSPRFPGVVKKVLKITGQPVQKNEVLAVIESNESLVKYKLKSAIRGIVIEMHMSLGENVDDNSHHFTVADLSVVWANLSIYQEDIFNVKKNQKATIKSSDNVLETDAVISYISPVVNEQTRTSTARVILNNTDGHWKPGMFVTATVATTKKEVALAVRKSAIMIYKGQQVVFVKEKNAFRPQPVTIGIQNDKMVEIISGLFKGQEYISEGAFLLKAELLKESFGGGHSH
jgi:cobalt-zinc-cadmium efflux system membrane fusion protein